MGDYTVTLCSWLHGLASYSLQNINHIKWSKLPRKIPSVRLKINKYSALKKFTRPWHICKLPKQGTLRQVIVSNGTNASSSDNARVHWCFLISSNQGFISTSPGIGSHTLFLIWWSNAYRSNDSTVCWGEDSFQHIGHHIVGPLGWGGCIQDPSLDFV